MKSVARAMLMIGLAAPFFGGCQYYSVQDMNTGKGGYMAVNWSCRKYNDTGTRFKDLKTGKEMILEKTTVEKIPFDEAWAELAAASGKPSAAD